MVLNNLQRLICHKTQTNKQTQIILFNINHLFRVFLYQLNWPEAAAFQHLKIPLGTYLPVEQFEECSQDNYIGAMALHDKLTHQVGPKWSKSRLMFG